MFFDFRIHNLNLVFFNNKNSCKVAFWGFYIQYLLSDIYSANHSIKKEKKCAKIWFIHQLLKGFRIFFVRTLCKKRFFGVSEEWYYFLYTPKRVIILAKKPLLTTIERQYKSQLLLAWYVGCTTLFSIKSVLSFIWICLGW